MTMSVPLYSVTVRRAFIAQHFLVGGDWGRENEVNSHRYRIEARYKGQGWTGTASSSTSATSTRGWTAW